MQITIRNKPTSTKTVLPRGINHAIATAYMPARSAILCSSQYYGNSIYSTHMPTQEEVAQEHDVLRQEMEQLQALEHWTDDDQCRNDELLSWYGNACAHEDHDNAIRAQIAEEQQIHQQLLTRIAEEEAAFMLQERVCQIINQNRMFEEAQRICDAMYMAKEDIGV